MPVSVHARRGARTPKLYLPGAASRKTRPLRDGVLRRVHLIAAPIRAPGHEQLVTGFEEAGRTADALAERLEW